MKRINVPKLIFSIVICELAGVIGSLFTFRAVRDWYPTLMKPDFNPPSWVFGPVWTGLFFLMGISLYILFNRKKDLPGQKSLLFFCIQLCLNVLWSILFFSFHSIGAALGEIVLLWIAIALTIYFAMKVSKTAAVLLVPYIAWVSFAAYLNYSIWILNS